MSHLNYQKITLNTLIFFFFTYNRSFRIGIYVCFPMFTLNSVYMFNWLNTVMTLRINCSKFKERKPNGLVFLKLRVIWYSVEFAHQPT